jgi:hypothetical protein
MPVNDSWLGLWCHDADEEHGWEETYHFERVKDEMCGDHPHLQQFKERREGEGDRLVVYTTHYHQTYGGGPEGGYFVITRYSSTTEVLNQGEPEEQEFVYKVNRTWGEPFTVELQEGKVLWVRDYNAATGLAKVRLVDEDYESVASEDEEEVEASG